MTRRLKRVVPLALLVTAVLGGAVYADVGAELARPVSGPGVFSIAGDTGWTVGERRPDGLRIVPNGRSDASAVLDSARFDDARVREAYAIAQRVPATLNQLYCWCGCVGNPMMGNHRSALECFESTHAANCDVCLVNAEVAWELAQQGITDAARIQATIDERYGRAS